MKKNLIFFIISLIILIIISIPRFNRQDIGLQGTTELGAANKRTSDVAQYINMVKYFRDEVPASELNSPFSSRPLVPYLASLLPLDEMTSLNIINFISLYLSIIILFKILTILNFSDRMKMLGCLMFIVSFPTFYYGVIGITDPVLILFIMLATLFTLQNDFILLALTFVVGAFVKEIILISIIVAIIFMIVNREKRSSLILKSFLYVILFGVSYFIARRVIPVNEDVYWVPYSEQLFYNLSRPRTYLSFLLSLSIQGIIAGLALFNFKFIFKEEFKKYTIVFATGFILSILLFLFSIVSAYSDGRFIWPSYPYTIPLALYFIKYYFENKNTVINKYLAIPVKH